MEKLVNHLRKRREGAKEDLSRSLYSLVSSSELTPEAVQLWIELPDEIKYDPALEQFKERYEQEHGVTDGRPSYSNPSKRLPEVHSAPHLNDTGHTQDEIVYQNGNKTQEKETTPDKNPTGDASVSKKTSKMAQARQTVKLTILIGVWLFFTVVFLMYNEKVEITRHSYIASGETKDYILRTNQDKLSVFLKLTQRDASTHCRIILENENQIDFQESEVRTSILSLKTLHNNRSIYAVRMRTSSNVTTPFTLSYTVDPLDKTTGIVYALILLCALYVLIVFEVINRTMSALLLSTASLGALTLAGERPSLTELVTWVDVETLLLLFSMMLLVAIMTETGLFDYIAVLTFQLAKGRIWPLITMLCVITTVVSLLLDNVTTVLFMTPVTIRLCEVMNLDPIPVLMSMILYCNLGGTATPVGDPPNVIIASNKAVVQAGINFANFTLHMTLGIVLVWVQTYLQLRYMYRDTSKFKLRESREIQDLRHQISIWRRAADSLPTLSRDQLVVRERLEKKIAKLTARLKAQILESSRSVCSKDTYETMLAEMRLKYKIRDKSLLVKCCVTIAFVIIVFFLHSIPEFNGVSLGWTALLGALLLLTLADREDLEPILHRIEWSTLLFFAALFVLMEALAKLGLIDYIGGWTEDLILSVDEKDRLALALILMVWVSGITSAFVDNVPLTTMMIRVVTSLGNNPTLNLPIAPLIWALSYGVCLGGNGTLIGASSNVVCAGVAEQHGYRFTFMQFFKIGFPVMLGHLVVASGYLLLCHCVFQWH